MKISGIGIDGGVKFLWTSDSDSGRIGACTWKGDFARTGGPRSGPAATAGRSAFAKATARLAAVRSSGAGKHVVAADDSGVSSDSAPAKRTGLGIDGFYVEQSKRQGVRMRERKISIRFVWHGIESR